MIKQKSVKSIALLLAVITLFVSVITVDVFRPKEIVSAEKTSAETSLLDGVINLVSEKGAGIIKDNLPTVGDFLCSKIFDYFEIDYSDSYTKEIKKVNEKLSEIQNDLTELLKNQEKQVSQNTMISFYNSLNVFSDTVYPIYNGYNTLMQNEKDGLISADEAREKEKEFYDANLKNLIFGSSSSTGSLYLQLKTLCDSVVLPNVSVAHINLLGHYVVSYEHMWAFNTQSFTPKKEFLGYVSTTLLEGLTMYTFMKTYEMSIASDTQKAVIEGEWAKISPSIKSAFEYLKTEINALSKEIKDSEESNTVLHYSTNKKLSRKLYVSKGFPCAADNHFTYVIKRSTTRQGNMRTVKVETLNNESFIDRVQKEFLNYKKYHVQPNATMADFLKSAGFTCSDWSHAFYRKQTMTHKGTFMTNEYYEYYTHYLSQDGLSFKSVNWGRLKYKVFGSPTGERFGGNDWSYIAFVGENGVLLGSYDTIYRDNGNTTVDAMYSMFNGYSCKIPSAFGKVW